MNQRFLAKAFLHPRNPSRVDRFLNHADDYSWRAESRGHQDVVLLLLISRSKRSSECFVSIDTVARVKA